MNIAALTAVIEARLSSDDAASVGILTLLNSRWYNTQAPPNTAYPYMVYNISGLSQDFDTFRSDGQEVTVDFHIYESARSGLVTVSAILDRLYGNGTLQSDRVPTYGFHRWKPTLPVATGSWTADTMHRVGNFSQSDTKDAYHFIETYQLIISR